MLQRQKLAPLFFCVTNVVNFRLYNETYFIMTRFLKMVKTPKVDPKYFEFEYRIGCMEYFDCNRNMV